MTQRKGNKVRCSRRRFRTSGERLELRALLSGQVFVVTTTLDSTGSTTGGPGPLTLRQAILDANAAGGANTIDFNIENSGSVQAIFPMSPLPTITSPVLIDGSSQGGAGYTGPPLIDIDGTNAGPDAAGLVITAGESTIRGLAIDQFSGDGIDLDGPGGNTFVGNFIGTDTTGETAQGNGGSGVAIIGSSNNTIGGTTAGAGNLISGNATAGVEISASQMIPPSSNLIEGNDIGTDRTAMKALGNEIGVEIDSGATANTIGGNIAAASNVIRGNTGDGVLISGAGAAGNTVDGDLIGICQCGTGPSPLGNGTGVEINSGAADNLVGGTVAGARNIISSNTTDGVLITGDRTTGNIVEGDFLGTAVSGQTPLGNDTGVEIDSGATANLIGGSAAAAGNVVSGNLTAGVGISGDGTSGNMVEGNTIGAGVSGQSPLPNGTGVEIGSGATANVIGGSIGNTGNLISGNSSEGVLISGSGTSDNTVAGNLIGTGISGQTIVANASGVEITGGATLNRVGGSVAAARNVVSGNAGDGVFISGSGTTDNTVAGNYIGTDLSGQLAVGNGIGVLVTGGSATTIGGFTGAPGTGAGNVISGNITAGIEVDGAAAAETQILGNLIGTNAAGNAAVVRTGQTDPLQALQNAGVAIISSKGNVIGGTSSAARNVISGNYVGVNLALISASSNPTNSVLGNWIGTSESGANPLGNTVGIYLNGAADNRVGGSGSATASANVISGNTSVGVEIVGSGSTGNLIEANLIGPAANGEGAFTGRGGLFIQSEGIFIQDASANTIGGPTSKTGNVISGNNAAGVFIVSLSGVSERNTIQRNKIGLSQNSSPTLGNAGYGILLANARNNTIVLNGAAANQFGRNGIENVRIYQGALRPSPVAASTRVRRVDGLARAAVRAARNEKSGR